MAGRALIGETARRQAHRSRVRCVLALVTVIVALGAPPLAAQAPPARAAESPVAPGATAGSQRPFHVGERLEYAVRLSAVNLRGHGAMWVGPREMVRGTETYVLHFGFKARLGPLRVADATASWLDPVRMASLRFVRRERQPFASRDEDVALFPYEQRWSAADGRSGANITDAPLDELSFIYLLRTIPLVTDSTYRFNRHFDAARNPTLVRVVRREQLKVGAGTFAAVLVEMRVRDPARYRGEGVIRIHFSDDDRRLPLRIESTLPVAGTAVLTLERLP